MMKNLTKIFMAVVAGMFAFSCVTDTTDDLGVELGNESTGKGETIISLSMAEARTHISEAVGNKYPMYWSENDKISVNGVTSTNIVLNENKTVATFTIPSNDFGDTWNIAYPATAANQVEFAKNQTHTAGTFGNDVTTMYASCPANEATTLNHLTAVLKLGLKGSAVLDKVQISTIDRAPIAGTFTLDFESGKTTPTSTATPIITYSFGDAGLTLGEAAQYIHVVVPAGEYEELYLTLFEKGTSGNVMYATVRAPKDNPETEKVENLAAGQMRSFGELEYSANATLFVIDSTDKLVAFKKAIESTESPLTSDAVLVNDVEAPEDWEPINGDSYTKTLYGNGYAINGLKAPLFNTTSASIKGLHLTGVAIEETETPKVAAFARSMLATDAAAPTFTNCTASGKITVNCTAYTPTSTGHKDINIAGFVGHVEGVVFSNCTNNVELDIQQVAKSGNTAATTACVGGIVGFSDGLARTDKSAVASSFINCTNDAAITYADPSFTGTTSADSYKGAPILLWVGGIFGGGYNTSNANSQAENLTNNGSITIKDDVGQLFIGGVLGHSYTSKGNNLINNAEIKVENCSVLRMTAGGVVGCTQSPSSMSNSQNNGTLNLSNTCNACNGEMGGFIGLCKGGASYCNNNTPITFNCNTLERTKKYGASKAFRLGGVIGDNQGNAVDHCYNTENGTITVAAALHNADTSSAQLCLGGVAGYAGTAITNCGNSAAINIDAALTKPEEISLDEARFSVSGGIGLINVANCSDITNSGDITITGTYDGWIFVGGAFGQITQGGATGFKNSGKVIINKEGGTSKFNHYLSVGGVGGLSKDEVSSSENLASAEVIVNEGATFVHEAKIGGAIGHSVHAATDITNRGAVSVLGGTYDNRAFIGGVIGYGPNALTNLQNIDGKITIGSGATFNNETYIGGVAALSQLSSTDTSNSGDISILGTYNGNTCIAGNTAWIFTNSTATRCGNSGTITLEKGVVFANKGTLPGGYADVVAYENVNPFVAGCIATSIHGTTTVKGGTMTECSNDGKIVVADGAELAGAPILAGLVAYSLGVVDNCENRGNITIKPTATFGTTNVLISGGVGYNAPGRNSSAETDTAVESMGSVTNVTNKGAISIAGTNPCRFFVGGCLGFSQHLKADDGSELVKKLYNYGPISLAANMTTAASSTNVGGVACFLAKNAAELYNYKEATITVNHSESSSNVFVAGIAVDADYHITKAENHAAITVSGKTSNDTYATYIAGIIAYHAGVCNRTDLLNTGEITFGTTSTPQVVAIGGLLGSGVRTTCTNCHNKGNITVDNLNIEVTNGGFTCGGIMARIMDAKELVTLSNCTNSGEITIDASQSNSPAYVGGIVASFASKGETLTITGDAENDNIGVKNSGAINITSNPNNTLAVGGILGYSTKAFANWTGVVTNTGNLSVTMKNDKTLHYGGMFGLLNNTDLVLSDTASYINTGNITCTGTDVGHTAEHDIGGIVGCSKATITNARCYCTITAWGYSDVGMIRGRERGTIPATNCYVGGAIDKGDGYGAANNIPLSKDIYWGFIYGTLPADNPTDVINLVVGKDKCGYLGTSVNDDPEFASVPSGDTAE